MQLILACLSLQLVPHNKCSKIIYIYIYINIRKISYYQAKECQVEFYFVWQPQDWPYLLLPWLNVCSRKSEGGADTSSLMQ